MTTGTLTVGSRVPEFSLEADDGSVWNPARMAGQRVVLYFYPKDDTPGCTTEACAFRDLTPELKAAGVVVLGVSPDSIRRHVSFRTKYDLPFPLLSDPDATAARAFGVWGTKRMYGKEYEGIIRSTFLIAADGTIAQVWENVKVAGHAEAVLEAVRAQGGA